METICFNWQCLTLAEKLNDDDDVFGKINGMSISLYPARSPDRVILRFAE